MKEDEGIYYESFLGWFRDRRPKRGLLPIYNRLTVQDMTSFLSRPHYLVVCE